MFRIHPGSMYQMFLKRTMM